MSTLFPRLQLDFGDVFGTATRTLRAVPEGIAGTIATLNQMVLWTRQYSIDQQVLALASRIVAPVPPKSPYDEGSAVQDWVRGSIRYTADPVDVETLQTPLVTVSRGQGDCDDQALLVGALLRSVGYAVRYRAVALDGPGLFEHVLAEMRIGDRWYGVETTEDEPFGWIPPSDFPPLIRTV